MPAVGGGHRTLAWPDGSVYRIIRSSEETAGELLEMELDVPAGAWAPAAHVHPELTEEYEVLDGGFDVLVQGRWRRLEIGDFISIPPGTVHTFRFGATPARVRNVHRPAVDFEPYVRELCQLANRHGLREVNSLRGRLCVAALLRRYPRHSRAPSALLQAAIIPAAIVARGVRLA